MNVYQLKDVCKMYQPSTISTKEMVPDGKYVVYGANGPIGRYNKFNHEERQLLVTCRGATCGSVNISEPFAWINGNAMVIQPKNNLVTLDYLKYAFLGGIDLSTAITGSAQPQITRTSLEVIEIPVPTIAEQNLIVQKLDDIFLTTDQLVMDSQSVKETVSNLFSLIIDKWIDSYSGNETVDLSNLAEMKGRIGWRGLTAKEYTESGPLFLSVHSLNHGHYVDFSRAFHISQERYDESPEIHLQEGFILIAKDGYVGKAAMVGEITEPTTVNSSLLVVKPNKGIKTKYLYCYFLSSYFKNLVKERIAGSTIPHLYQRDIAKIPVIKLNEKQQDEFIDKFEKVSVLLEEYEKNLEKKIQLLSQLRRAILSDSFGVMA